MLNPNQKEAVNYFNSHLLIIAGPGTGKTHTLTQKIIYAIKKRKISPKDILALTFTNKAREELNSRLKDHNLNNLAHTFHSFSLKILNLPEINIINSDDRSEFINKLAKESKLKARDLEHIISTNKIKNIPDLFTQKYNDYLKSNNLLDYDDLLLNTFNLPQIPQYQYLFIDEFQDTSDIQYQIIKKLRPKHITAIGDPHQSIYGFRGAIPDIFLKFQKPFV